jgi:tripartite-type tricarboxylate transporter receptor subunit TctC
MLAAPLVLILAACSSPAQSGDGPAGEVPGEGEWVGSLTAYIPATAGGGFDIAVRAIQDPLAELLGESVVPTNLEGAGGSIAATEMLGGPADGSSMMIVSRSISALPYTGTPEIDPVEDFTALGVTHQDVAAITVPSDAPYQTIDEFIDFAKDNPGKVTIGHSGIGGVWHAAALILARELGTEFEFVPYGGGSAVGAALLAGEIDAMTIGAPETRPFVEGGDATMLAVMGEERSALYPDVPTLIESGIDVTYSVWRGFVTAADTPDAVAAELSARLEAAAKSDEFLTTMGDAGFETTWIGAADFQALIAEEDILIRDLFDGEDFMTTQPKRLG